MQISLCSFRFHFQSQTLLYKLDGIGGRRGTLKELLIIKWKLHIAIQHDRACVRDLNRKVTNTTTIHCFSIGSTWRSIIVVLFTTTRSIVESRLHEISDRIRSDLLCHDHCCCCSSLVSGDKERVHIGRELPREWKERGSKAKRNVESVPIRGSGSLLCKNAISHSSSSSQLTSSKKKRKKKDADGVAWNRRGCCCQPL